MGAIRSDIGACCCCRRHGGRRTRAVFCAVRIRTRGRGGIGGACVREEETKVININRDNSCFEIPVAGSSNTPGVERCYP